MSFGDFFDDVLDIFGGKKDIEVLMFGHSGVGKTTTMTAMFNEYQDNKIKSKNSYYNLFVEDNTYGVLRDKLAELKGQIGEKTIKFDPTLAGSAEISKYKFYLAKKRNNNSRLNITFTDIPGGYLKSEKDMIRELLNKSKIIIVSVDSAALMESYKGQKSYNYNVNDPDDIKNQFDEIEKTDNKLIIFNLLKSEKYFDEGRLKELEKKFKEEYKNVLAMVEGREEISMAFLPVQTLGSVYFSEIVIDKDNKSKFIFKTKYNGVYQPSETEKILFLILRFIIAEEFRDTSFFRTIKLDNLEKKYNELYDKSEDVKFLQNKKLTTISL